MPLCGPTYTVEPVDSLSDADSYFDNYHGRSKRVRQPGDGADGRTNGLITRTRTRTTTTTASASACIILRMDRRMGTVTDDLSQAAGQVDQLTALGLSNDRAGFARLIHPARSRCADAGAIWRDLTTHPEADGTTPWWRKCAVRQQGVDPDRRRQLHNAVFLTTHPLFIL
jgi:hypothetical protein